MKSHIIIAALLLSFSFFNWADGHKSILMSGQLKADFSSWGSPALSGDWKIVLEDGVTYLHLDKNFQAKKGPDVKIFLSRKAVDEIEGSNAKDEAVFIKLLEEFKGPKKIKLPEDIDITTFKSIVFHCEEYSKLWGTSPLSQADDTKTY